MSATVRSRSRYMPSVVPSSNTLIIGISGKTYLQAEFRLETQIVILQERIALNEDVRHRMLVVLEARHGQLACHHAAASQALRSSTSTFLPACAI